MVSDLSTDDSKTARDKSRYELACCVYTRLSSSSWFLFSMNRAIFPLQLTRMFWPSELQYLFLWWFLTTKHLFFRWSLPVWGILCITDYTHFTSPCWPFMGQVVEKANLLFYDFSGYCYNQLLLRFLLRWNEYFLAFCVLIIIFMAYICLWS